MTRRTLAIAVAVVVASHLLFLATVATPKIVADAAVLQELAVNLVAGKGYVRGGEPHIWFMPGYPLFIAAIYRVAGGDPWIVRVVQAFLVGVSAACAFQACRSLFGVRPAWTAFVMVGALPAWFIYPGTLTAETLVLALGSVFVWIVARDLPALSYQRLIWAGAAGLMTGAMALVKPEFAVWAAAPAVVAYARRRPPGEAVGLAIVAVIACALVVAPWTLRNAVVFGRFIPFSISGGVAFWGSAHRPELMDYGEAPFRAAVLRCGAAADDASNARLGADPKAVDSCLWREGIQMTRDHPMYWIETSFRRAARTLFGSHTTYLVGYSMAFEHARGAAFWVKLALLVVHVGFVLAGLAGLAWLLRVREGWFLVYLFASKLLVHAVIFGTPRYGLHLTPVFAVAGGAFVYTYVLSRRRSAA